MPPLLQVARAASRLLQASDLFLFHEISPKSRITAPAVSAIRCPSDILADTFDQVHFADGPIIGFLSANWGEARLGW